MPLKLYRITSALEVEGYRDYTARAKKNARDISLFFMLDRGEKQTKKRRLEFVAGTGYTLDNIEKTDFIDCPSALLFSKRFVKRIGNVLSEEMQFFPCKLICQNVSFDWYAAKIIRRVPVIDKKTSTYTTTTDGEKILEFAKFRKDVEEEFFIARDTGSIVYDVVSERFKELCTDNGLLISFADPDCPFPCV